MILFPRSEQDRGTNRKHIHVTLLITMPRNLECMFVVCVLRFCHVSGIWYSFNWMCACVLISICYVLFLYLMSRNYWCLSVVCVSCFLYITNDFLGQRGLGVSCHGGPVTKYQYMAPKENIAGHVGLSGANAAASTNVAGLHDTDEYRPEGAMLRVPSYLHYISIVGESISRN